MRLGWSKKGNSISYYVHKTIYVDGKNKSKVIKRLGSEKYICETYGVTDAKAWARHQVDIMREAEKEESGDVLLTVNPMKDLVAGQQHCFNGGYLFLQDIYHSLGLDKICRAIAKKHGFEFNLNAILSRLIYTRILYPASKRNSFEDSCKFIEAPSFELHHIYRALSVLAQESDYIQSTLFKNSLKLTNRNTSVIYYDCTNFYFEIEKAQDDKQFGISKENRPLPIIQMGLFMDANGIPLAFSMNPGNQNEQLSLIPLEKKLLSDFGMSRFVVCTDAGLSSNSNRQFNDYEDDEASRAFVTTQSIKKLKGYQKEWALSSDDWYLSGDDSGKKYNISELDDEADRTKVFYKCRWINENHLEQQLIVSYSIKYRDYLRSVRDGQIDRAAKTIKNGSAAMNKKRQTDPKRFIKTDHTTKDGEIADNASSYLDQNTLSNEELYDGFYAVCTNLDDSPEAIVKINQRRWEIEECFRIMKSEFKARPVYLQRPERIEAHFITCFLSLIVYRYLEKKLDDKYTCAQLISQLQEMNFLKFEGCGYLPTYTRTTLTDTLHEVFGFNTSKEIISVKKMKNICAMTKKPKA